MKEFDAVVDSGQRTNFETGSRRDVRTGKGRFDLISPFVLERFAKHFENGAVKYGDRNWELGQPVMTYFDSAMRHMNKWLQGQEDEDHLCAAMWNIHCMIHTLLMVGRGLLPDSLDDRPRWSQAHSLTKAEESRLGRASFKIGNGEPL